jgi:hypothetical protein
MNHWFGTGVCALVLSVLPWRCQEGHNRHDGSMPGLDGGVDEGQPDAAPPPELDAGGDGDAAEDGGAPFPPGTLGNGGEVTGVDDITLSALSDSLSEPVAVDIVSAPEPSEALPDGATRVGRFFSVSAAEDRRISTSRPVLVRIPVPAGADVDHLGLAVRCEPDEFLDVEHTGPVWLVLDGLYLPEENELVATLGTLSASARTYALVEHSDMDSAGVTSIAPARPIPPIPGPPPTDTSEVAHAFHVTCRGLRCDSALTDEVEALLTTALTELKAMHYPSPRLSQHLERTSPHHFVVDGYNVYLVPVEDEACSTNRADPDASHAQGLYSPPERVIYLCMQHVGLQLSDGQRTTLIHEYFHATQHAFDETDAHPDEAWLIEGTAAAAELSYLNDHHMYRNPTTITVSGRTDERSWHPIDIGLRSEEEHHEYEAQDFWVFAGEHQSQDMGWLIRIFDAGATIDAIEASLTGPSLADLYWAWVKNQLMAKTVDYSHPADLAGRVGGEDDGGLGPRCQMNAVEPPDYLSCTEAPAADLWGRGPTEPTPVWRAYAGTNPYPSPDPAAPGVVQYHSLEPLTATAIRVVPNDGWGVGGPDIVTDPPLPRPGWVRITLESSTGSGDFRYIVYNNGESGCEDVDDMDHDRDTAYIDTCDPAFWVVVANTNPRVTRGFRLTASPSPAAPPPP